MLVRVTGLEPARRGHQNLNLARLPIPPYPRVRLVYPFCGYLSILMMVLIGSGALAKRAESALTPRGRTRGETPAVSTLLRITPFPWIVWRRLPICDRSKIWGTAEDFFFRIFLNLFAGSDSILLHRPESLRRRDITVSRNSLARCNARHLRIKHLVQFILVGAVYHNALTNCAALLCRACVE